MITKAGYALITENLNMAIKEGRYFIGNTAHSIPIRRTERHENGITFYLYLADDVEGNLTRFQLVDAEGKVFTDQAAEIEKTRRQSLLVSFEYTLKKAE